MLRGSRLLAVGGLAGLLLAGMPGRGAAAVTRQERDLLRQVSDRLVAVAKAPAAFAWPPTFQVQDEEELNAFATAGPVKGGKPTLRVTVTAGMISQAAEGDPDRLAFVVAHEIAHLLLGHVKRDPRQSATPFLAATFGRQQEIAADQKGMELALAAGYSYQSGARVIQRMLDLGLTFSSFEGLGSDHPAWRDRLAFLDKRQASLWRAMSAFETGGVFLTAEQYAAAESCFRRVTREFPRCGEAWANLGYALLMQYCDALAPDDLRRLKVGHIACGGFYRRPASLEARVQTRATPDALWAQAVAALIQALRIEPDLVLAKSNLGIAYLIRPEGPDARRATEQLSASAKVVTQDPSLDPLARAVVLLNAGVAGLAAGDRAACIANLDSAERSFTRAFTGKAARRRAAPSFEPALLYNRALLLASSEKAAEQARAGDAFLAYLKASSPASIWWPVAYAEYEEACRRQGRRPVAPAALQAQAPPAHRPIAAVALPGGKSVSLAEPIADVQARLGPADTVPVLEETNLRRLRYPRLGVELLATDEVLAICLVGPRAPELRVRGLAGSLKPLSLKVGMTRQALDLALRGEESDVRQLADPNVKYSFYRSLGLAVRAEKSSVAELVVVQIPERQ